MIVWQSLLSHYSNRILWEKSLFLDKNGKQIWKGISFYKEETRDVITSFAVSNSGKYIMADINYAEPVEGGRFIGTNVLSIIETRSDKTLFKMKISDLCADKDMVAGLFLGILEKDRVYLSIGGHSYEFPEKDCHILFDLMSQKIIYRGKYLGRFANDGRLIIAGSRVYIFKGGK